MNTCGSVGSFDGVAGKLGSLGNSRRLHIMLLLKGGEMSVSEIQARLPGAGQSGISHHLARLAFHGLVKSRWEGRKCYYRIASREMGDMVSFAVELTLSDSQRDAGLKPEQEKPVLAVGGATLPKAG